MGVLLTDAVVALHPEHAGHHIEIEGPGRSVTPILRVPDNKRFNWFCSCGAAGTIEFEEVGQLLRDNKIHTF